MVQNETQFPDLRWSASMSELLAPDFALSKEYESSHTTLEDALSHRSGLPRHDYAYGWGNASVIENVRRMRYLPMTAEPRTRWQYCNLMYGTAGAMIEKHTGHSLEDVLRTWIWEPLGMRSTAFAACSDTAKKNLARGYFWHGDAYYIPGKYYNIIPVAGAGAIISSVNDYALWIKALLNAAGPSFVNKTNPITTSLFADVTTPRIVLPSEYRSSGAPITYALGWLLARAGPYNVITHGGGVPGFLTDVFLVPELRLGFVSVCNSWSEEAAVAGTKLFLEVLTGLEKVDVESLESLESDGLLEAKKEMMVPGATRDIERANVAAQQDTEPLSKATKAESRPLPGNIHDYVGLYSHPAYGVLNISFLLDKKEAAPDFTLHQTLLASSTASSKIMLLAEPSPRLWSNAFALSHDTFSTFYVQAVNLHGDDDDVEGCKRSTHNAKASVSRVLECRNEMALVVAFISKAIFEYGLDGEVEWLGAEMELEMVRDAQESLNREGRKKGMIWFEKVR